MKERCERITDAELAVMHVLWRAARPLPLGEIRIQLAAETNWESSTIKTLLRRLCEKGAVKAEKNKTFHYLPLVTEEEYENYCADSLIDRVFGGSAKHLMASLVRGGKLSGDDVTELIEMLERGDFDD